MAARCGFRDAELGISRGRLSSYRNGHTLGDEMAIRIADELGIDRGYVLACMAAERAKSNTVRDAWAKAARAIAGAAAALVLVYLVGPELSGDFAAAAMPFVFSTHYAMFAAHAVVAALILLWLASLLPNNNNEGDDEHRGMHGRG